MYVYVYHWIVYLTNLTIIVVLYIYICIHNYNNILPQK